jgi:hypothetical protein
MRQMLGQTGTAPTGMLGHAHGAKCTVLIASFYTTHRSQGQDGNATPHQGAAAGGAGPIVCSVAPLPCRKKGVGSCCMDALDKGLCNRTHTNLHLASSTFCTWLEADPNLRQEISPHLPLQHILGQMPEDIPHEKPLGEQRRDVARAPDGRRNAPDMLPQSDQMRSSWTVPQHLLWSLRSSSAVPPAPASSLFCPGWPLCPWARPWMQPEVCSHCYPQGTAM